MTGLSSESVFVYHYDTFTKRYVVFDHGKLVCQFERGALNILKLAFPGIKET